MAVIKAAHMRAEAFKPPDDKWRQMRAIWLACTTAGVDVPDVVEHFFNYDPPDEQGVVISCGDLLDDGVITDWSSGAAEGIEIHMDKVPPGVTVIRVCNAYSH